MGTETKVEVYKRLALGLLGSNQQWMTFTEIAADFRESDGDVDEGALSDALDALVAEWKIWDDDCGAFHWAPPQEGESLAEKLKRLEAENETLRAEQAADRAAVRRFTRQFGTLLFMARGDAPQQKEPWDAHAALLDRMAMWDAPSLPERVVDLSGNADSLVRSETDPGDGVPLSSETRWWGHAPGCLWIVWLRGWSCVPGCPTLETARCADDKSEPPRSGPCQSGRGESGVSGSDGSRFVMRSPDEVLEIAMKHSARIKAGEESEPASTDHDVQAGGPALSLADATRRYPEAWKRAQAALDSKAIWRAAEAVSLEPSRHPSPEAVERMATMLRDAGVQIGADSFKVGGTCAEQLGAPKGCNCTWLVQPTFVGSQVVHRGRGMMPCPAHAEDVPQTLRFRREIDEASGEILYRREPMAQARYVGEFGDIDEPSVGDVEGYGRRG